jgi:hypothetical protein
MANTVMDRHGRYTILAMHVSRNKLNFDYGHQALEDTKDKLW